MLLGDPQSDVGGAGDDARVRMRDAGAPPAHRSCRGADPALAVRLRSRASRSAAPAQRFRRAAPRRASSRASRRPRCRTRASPRRARRRRTSLPPPRGSADSRCSGTGCPTARRRSSRCDGAMRVLVEAEQAHHEARRAEAALRAVRLDHRLLHRMQRAVVALQALDGEHRLARDRRQEPDAGVDRLPGETSRRRRRLGQDDRAGAAVAFGAAFLGAGELPVLAQPLEQRGLRRDDRRRRPARR